MNARLLLLGTVFLCAGCASAPERRALTVRIDTPRTFTAAGDTSATAIAAHWWGTFGDSVLTGVVNEALAGNFDIAVASSRVSRAAAQARIAGADLWPQLNASGAASRSRTNILGFPTPTGEQNIEIRSNTFGVSLDTGWEIDLWGRVRKGRSAAAADLEAAWADLAAARLSLAAQTAKAYFATVAARRQLDLGERIVASYERSAARVKTRYRQGVRSSVDVRIAQTSLENARASLALTRRRLDAVTRQLEILLGRYPAARLATASGLPHLGQAPPAGLPSTLLIRRPDLLAAERRYAAAEARVSGARRAFFPRITLTGSGGTQTDELRELTNLDFGIWRLAAGLVQPIFQGGRLRANLAASHAASDQALAGWAQAMLRAFGEVEIALASEKTLAERERHVARAVRESEAARRLAERQYNAGLIDYITLLETQRQSFSAQSNLITAQRELLDSRINLYLALGGGFDARGEWKSYLETLGRGRPGPNGGAR